MKKYNPRIRRLFSCIIFIISLCPLSVLATTITHAAHGGKYPAYPNVNYVKNPRAAQIRHGEYLVKAGDCIACHTNSEHNGDSFAGGNAIVTPFGTIYGPNITPDKTTGIGKWTDEQFARAIQKGIAPDGSYYFPALPYLFFNKLSQQDALDIRAYLNVIPPIHQQNKPVDMAWPFRWRFLQLGWRILFFHPTDELKPDPTKSAQWNRGSYLVQTLGHCAMCHTPLNFLGSPKWTYNLTGGFIQGFYAPNISGTELKDVSQAQIVDVFLEDNLIGGGRVAGPMEEVNHDSLKYLEKSDLIAIATYLKTVKSKQPPKLKPPSNIDSKVGEKIYNQYCMGCHGTGAGGAPKTGDATAWDPLLKQGLNILYQNAIAGIGGMPPKGTCIDCSTAEIQATVRYLVDQVQQDGRETSSSGPASKATPADMSIAHGKKIYNTTTCALCHNSGAMGAPKIGDKIAWTPRIKQNLDVLFQHVVNGFNNMPPKGACMSCTNADLLAAIKYMVQESSETGDYSLW